MKVFDLPYYQGPEACLHLMSVVIAVEGFPATIEAMRNAGCEVDVRCRRTLYPVRGRPDLFDQTTAAWMILRAAISLIRALVA